MATDDTWDHEAYRSRFEPREHWELKEEFILANKKNIAEDELVCLANVYTNMTLMGCRYPAAVASRVRALSQGLGATYKERRHGKLMRTFVSASDAATAKIRRTDAPTTNGICEAVENSSGGGEGKADCDGEEAPPKKKKKRKRTAIESEYEVQDVKQPLLENEPEIEVFSKKKKKKVQAQVPESPQDEVEVLDVLVNPKKSKSKKEIQFNSSPAFSDSRAADDVFPSPKKKKKTSNTRTPDAEVTVLEEAPRSKVFKDLALLKVDEKTYHAQEIINNSFPHGTYHVEFDNDHIAAYVKHTVVARLPVNNTPKKALSEQLAREALKVIVKKCPLLVAKSQWRETNVSDDGSLLGYHGYTKENLQTISKDNVGCKLLQLMGWTGGGLGKGETGRVDPVEASMQDRRAGLGYTGSVADMGLSRAFKEKVESLLRNFYQGSMNGSTELEALVFPSIFSKEQRAFIHKSVGCRYNFLRSDSYGKGPQRHLVVKPKVSHSEKAKQVLERGGETNMFKALPPGTYEISALDLVPL